MPMTYVFIDTEFNAFQGELISMGLVCKEHKLYLINANFNKNIHPWVTENVIPHLYVEFCKKHFEAPLIEWKKYISRFMYDWAKVGDDVTIISDWYTDIEHFCNVIVGDNGSTVAINKARKVKFIVDRNLDQSREPLPGSIEHHALSDALNLQEDWYRRYPEPFEAK